MSYYLTKRQIAHISEDGIAPAMPFAYYSYDRELLPHIQRGREAGKRMLVVKHQGYFDAVLDYVA